MKAIVFVYNIFLLSLYTVVLSYSAKSYINKKHSINLYISILFLFYILDNTIIYMTEFLNEFSNIYNVQFLSVPTFKTIIFLVTGISLVLICQNVLYKKISLLDLSVYTVLFLFMSFAHFLANGNLMVWLYYLPYQIFTFYLSTSCLHYLNKNKSLMEKYYMKSFKKVLFLTAIFSIFILIEDTIVIFNFDIYSNVLIKINNRNISEDILSIIYAIYCIKYYCNPCLDISFSDNTKLSDNTIIENENLAIKNETDIDYKFLYFTYEYKFTTREIEILKLLLEHKTNAQISAELTISLGTVKTHIHNIFQKVNVTKRALLIDLYNDFCPDIK